MNGKDWWKSRTIIFALVAGLLTLITIFFKTDLSEFTGQITDSVLAMFAAYATFATIRGRVLADRAIKRTSPGGGFNPNAEVRKAEKP
jgi:drug/metabolite transporter (DMT)-like permease